MTTAPVQPKVDDTTSLAGREAIIHAIKTPLGFFSLVVLVVEAILGVVAGMSSGTDRTVAIVAMVVLIGLLVAIVAIFAYTRPEALQGLRYTSEPIREEPLELLKVERVFCGVTAEYGHLGFKDDIAIIRDEFCDDLIEDHSLTRASLEEALTSSQFTVIHLLGFVDPATGEFKFSENERISAEGLAKLVELCGARIVFLATCDSLLLAAKLAPRASVVAASGWVETAKFLSWERTFYRLLGNAKPLSEAYDVARATSDSPLVLLTRRDVRFVAKRKKSRRSAD